MIWLLCYFSHHLCLLSNQELITTKEMRWITTQRCSNFTTAPKRDCINLSQWHGSHRVWLVIATVLSRGCYLIKVLLRCSTLTRIGSLIWLCYTEATERTESIANWFRENWISMPRTKRGKLTEKNPWKSPTPPIVPTSCEVVCAHRVQQRFWNCQVSVRSWRDVALTHSNNECTVASNSDTLLG